MVLPDVGSNGGKYQVVYRFSLPNGIADHSAGVGQTFARQPVVGKVIMCRVVRRLSNVGMGSVVYSHFGHGQYIVWTMPGTERCPLIFSHDKDKVPLRVFSSETLQREDGPRRARPGKFTKIQPESGIRLAHETRHFCTVKRCTDSALLLMRRLSSRNPEQLVQPQGVTRRQGNTQMGLVWRIERTSKNTHPNCHYERAPTSSSIARTCT